MKQQSDGKCGMTSIWNNTTCKRRHCRGYAVNDRLNAFGAYLKTKAFGWALVRTWALIKRKKNKKCQASKLFIKITKLLPKFFPKLITKILTIFLIKLAYSLAQMDLVPFCTNPIFGKNQVSEIWAKMLLTNQIAGFLNQLYL